MTVDMTFEASVKIYALAIDIAFDRHHPLRESIPTLDDCWTTPRDVEKIARELLHYFLAVSA